MLNGTMTSMAGKITIVFEGITLALYFATLHTFTAVIHIDGDTVATIQQDATQPVVGNVLGYSNTSIPDGLHYVVIISEDDTVVDFDGLVYTTLSTPPVPPAVPSAVPSATVSSRPPPRPTISLLSLSHSSSFTSASSTSRSSQSNTPTNIGQSSSTTSNSPTTGPTTSPRTQSASTARRLPVAAIGGIAAAGVSLTAAVCIAATFLRRRGRQWKKHSVQQPFVTGDGDNQLRSRAPPTDAAAPPVTTNPVLSYVTDHLFKLEARFDALAPTVRRPGETANRSPPSSPGPPAYNDAA
ncbi:hypothetical protein DFH09DRAFT_1277062 [Mycena vulgaris]|nr:hypothetical protein DFH09DRAFT_1277062 [Mycena vulgaris]